MKQPQPLPRQALPKRTVSIIGTGSYLPERILTNAELEQMVETSDEWITTRTGIKERRIAADGEHTSDLAAKAGQAALENAGISADEVDLILVATVTPDMFFPSTACFVQSKIGARKAACFDVSAACSGFLYALEIAQQFISNQTYNTVLVIGADKLSSIVDWKDRNTCVLFGDGAGAGRAAAPRRRSRGHRDEYGQQWRPCGYSLHPGRRLPLPDNCRECRPVAEHDQDERQGDLQTGCDRDAHRREYRSRSGRDSNLKISPASFRTRQISGSSKQSRIG
jgi:hypothetical protein